MKRCPHLLGSVSMGIWLSAYGAGCGGDTIGTSRNQVDKDEFATAYAEAFCQGISDCCVANAIPFQLAGCQASLRANLSAQLTDGGPNDRLVYDADAATVCVNAYRDANAACTDRASYERAKSVCDIFRGTVAIGGACVSNGECKAIGEQTVSCKQGVCAIETSSPATGGGAHAKQGENCASTCTEFSPGGWSCSELGPQPSNSTASCWTDEGLYCDDNGTCTKLPSIGQACAQARYCTAAAYCLDGICVARLSSGSCQGNPKSCDDASYCETSSTECEPKKANGESCEERTECLGADCLGNHCRNWTVATPASCAGVIDD